MKTHPILFSTPMVQALRNGTKTMTRRCKGLEYINENPNLFRYDGICEDEGKNFGEHFFEKLDKNGKETEVYTPISLPYSIGDILWVRETFAVKGERLFYKADNDSLENAGLKGFYDFVWKPSIFMPLSAARIFLKITNIKIDRLQDITPEDAIAEGVERINDNTFLAFKSYATKKDFCCFAYDSFRTLWQSINKKKNTWEQNPWVIVYEFKPIKN